MSSVTLAAIKIGGIMLGLEPWQTVISAGLITVIFSTLGGFRGVVYTDFILFFVAMAGSIGAAYYLVNLPEVGGISALLSHENVNDKLSILPNFTDTRSLITLLIIPLAVQWWSAWYPGAEPEVEDISLNACWHPKMKTMQLVQLSFLILCIMP